MKYFYIDIRDLLLQRSLVAIEGCKDKGHTFHDNDFNLHEFTKLMSKIHGMYGSQFEEFPEI